MAKNMCTEPDCHKNAIARGMCRKHYARSYKAGRFVVNRQPRMSVAERFEQKVRREGACWVWTGARAPNGYGQFVLSGPRRLVFAHRLSYELHVGPIPEGLVIDHLCRVRACVNPQHLEPVTAAENNARGMAPTFVSRRLGICHRGHSLDDAYVNSTTGWRSCKPCTLATQAQYRARKKASRTTKVQNSSPAPASE